MKKKCCLLGILAGLAAFSSLARGQELAPSTQQVTTLSPELSRLEGTDPENQVVSVRLFLSGILIGTNQADAGPTRVPTLTAQCTKQPSGKLGFELFTDFGGVEDHAYHRPWMPRDGGMFAPVPGKATVTMEFLGYTHVKPVKRQWERLERPAGELRYNPPGAGSANMEDITFYLQYLKALPKLRLSYDGRSAEFMTPALLKRLSVEPLCRASGL